VWGRRSPLRSDFFDGSDRLMFSSESAGVAIQFGHQIDVRPGDAVILSGADPGGFATLTPGPIVTLEFPDGSLSRLLGDPRKSFLRTIASNDPALQLLRGYLRSFLSLRAPPPSQVENAAVTHLRDLAAFAVGPTRHSHEAASVRSIPAARLRAIKDDLLARLEDQHSLDEVAARHAVSARYVRMLFEREGTSFSEFVREERLCRARRLLVGGCVGQGSISDIAYSVGFNDLSYFNRTFRRRFGCSPREMQSAPR
jgi:AraC-like DNA-binding protein